MGLRGYIRAPFFGGHMGWTTLVPNIVELSNKILDGIKVLWNLIAEKIKRKKHEDINNVESADDVTDIIK